MLAKEPKWPITVPESLYAAVQEETSYEYADSYLWGAVADGTRLIPRTVTAWERLEQRKDVMAALKREGYTLIKPSPFGSKTGSHRSHDELVDDDFGKPRRARRPSYDPW